MHCAARHMSDDSHNPERRRSLDERDTDPFAAHHMRITSPLGIDEERTIHQVIGSAIAVHRALGPGFLESIYRQAMRIELDARGLRSERERSIRVMYRGVQLSGQRLDLIVNGLVVVELKAVSGVEEIHRAQLISYLRATGLRAGLLINFRVRVLKEGLHRIVLSQAGPSGSALR